MDFIYTYLMELSISTLFSGLRCPSEIQKRAIFPIIQGRDVIAKHQSEKETFAIALLQSIDVKIREVQVLYLSPNPDSAFQIKKVTLL